MKKTVFIILAMLLNLSCGNVIMDLYNNGVSPVLIDSTIIFADGAAVARQLGSGNYTNIVTGTGNGNITYTSGNESTATVNSSTGEVTLLALGTTVITATKAATSTFTAVTATYTLTVTALTPSSILFQDFPTVSRQLGSGNYTNTVTGGVGTGAITFTSGTPATATVNATTGEVTLVAVGTTVITATKAASGIYDIGISAYTLTVTIIPSTIIFADGVSVSRQLGSGPYTNTVTGTGDGIITYSSGTPGTATVNSSTGEVTLVAVGSTVITANKAATSMYSAVSESYTLTVTALTPSTIIFQDFPTVSRELGSGSYTNTVMGGVGTGTITYTSSDSLIAIVNAATGEVTINNSGTTIITATKAASGIYDSGTNSYTLTVLIPSTIQFADGSAVTKILGNPVYTNPAAGIGSGEITYFSGNPSTATVDMNTGAVTLVAKGTTVITAYKAATSTHASVTNTYTLTVLGIGSAYQGGIIAYILQSGDSGYDVNVPHGLIAAISDQMAGIEWITGGPTQSESVPGGTQDALGTGQANTSKIVNQAETIGENYNLFTYAAGICDAYINPDAGTGVYIDWYLPSKDELNKLYLNRGEIGNFVDTGDYWSSSECGADTAGVQYFFNGSQDPYYKSAYKSVRAVRSF